jgi:hypothetical protein
MKNILWIEDIVKSTPITPIFLAHLVLTWLDLYICTCCSKEHILKPFTSAQNERTLSCEGFCLKEHILNPSKGTNESVSTNEDKGFRV